MAPAILDAELKSSYTDELKRKDELTKAVGVPIAVLTLVGGVLVYVLNSIYSTNKLSDYIQLSGVGLTAAIMVIAAYFLIRAYFGYSTNTYQQLSSLWTGKLR